MKKFNLTKKQAKALAIGVCAVSLAAVLVTVWYSTGMKKTIDEPPEITSTVNTDTDVEVTAEELQTYKKNIGNGMDLKKSILIIFNTPEECQVFIDEHGNNDDVLKLGKGIIPEMQGESGEQYFNCVGNTVFEGLFDGMNDGEYLKEPAEFGGSFCYFKRIERVSIVDNDEDLKELIKREKTMRKGGDME